MIQLGDMWSRKTPDFTEYVPKFDPMTTLEGVKNHIINESKNHPNILYEVRFQSMSSAFYFGSEQYSDGHAGLMTFYPGTPANIDDNFVIRIVAKLYVNSKSWCYDVLIQ